ncbi:hypothetical protein FOTG_17402 [Fusarium oxysporum f. sp. vasinfectum 25433]|uniref:Uncharacterized protein n=1 Tax=Fusarium oxysporum f. sp. vasinfectum 25433 TaxID=1089449 RepID=X0KZR9_FUSOX|nr:hypothetical protein FOTG_17402 [Fusarium oxysporum f. sp. vasinfectum 25433]
MQASSVPDCQAVAHDGDAPLVSYREVGRVAHVISKFEAQTLSDGRFTLVFASSVQSAAQNDGTNGRGKGSGRLYHSYPVRSSKSYLPDHRDAPGIYCTVLAREQGVFRLSECEPVDVLEDLGLDFSTWPGHADFTVGPRGLLLSTARHPRQRCRPPMLPAIELHYLEVDWNTMSRAASSRRLGWGTWCGVPHSFSFSKDGYYTMFLQSERSDTCFDHESIFIIHLSHPGRARQLVLSQALGATDVQPWFPRILSVHWSSSCSNIAYVIVDEAGVMAVWKIQVLPAADTKHLTGLVTPVANQGSTSFLASVGSSSPSPEQLLVLRTEFSRAGIVEIIPVGIDTPPNPHLIDEHSIPAAHAAVPEEVSYSGAGGMSVQAFIHKPRDFLEHRR